MCVLMDGDIATDHDCAVTVNTRLAVGARSSLTASPVALGATAGKKDDEDEYVEN